MSHRGPDGAGVWISPDHRIGFGHRRLSIIDLSENAAQPMMTQDGRFVVVFNGEIYNHAEIRQELEQTGCRTWKTDHSDTEVILNAFARWGINCISRFRGMFAIALWDSLERCLWLIRDRIGIKPLYYSIHHGRITFASEIKALLMDPEQDVIVNEESLYHYLSFLTSPAPHTLFNAIYKLPSATWLKISAEGRTEQQTYWDVLDFANPLSNMDENEIADRVLSELRTSVRLRKVSDVPVGVFLSGGVDSSTNAALFAEGEATVKTFTIDYDNDYASNPSELRYARMMAQAIGAESYCRTLGVDDLLSFLPEMIRFQDEPIGDPVCVPIYYLSQLAREHGVTVCQVGEGADELFIGYPGWQQTLRLQMLDRLPLPGAAKRVAQNGLFWLGKGFTHRAEQLRRGIEKLPIFWGGAEGFSHDHKMALLSPRMRKRFNTYSSWEVLYPIWNEFQEKAAEPSDLNWMTYLDLRVRLPELLLMRVDKMSMAVGLEARVPFLDHQLATLALSIPSELKLKNGTLKYILKRAIRGLIPPELINRKKQGFGVPVHEWFHLKLRNYAHERLEHFCKTSDYLNWPQVEALFDQNQAQQIWYLLNLALTIENVSNPVTVA